MRRRYLVAYDISDKKRLHRVHRAMLGYGDPLQYSVFLCVLSEQERAMMLAHLLREISVTDDRVLIVDLGRAAVRRPPRAGGSGPASRRPPGTAARARIMTLGKSGAAGAEEGAVIV